ncbi:MAG TPA: helix-turn-helix domain-containing protein [Candidatus Binatia bacterium]|jgi:predicted DNA-binding transcriptional regulator AlpA|nr:helix-turn-helix domain-containing protein [Candidatus Binatia bacterium]
MSSKVVSISPESMSAKTTGKSAGADILARLERLEDSFLIGLQDIRAIKAELKKQTETTPGLEKLLDAKKVAELFGENERWVYQQAKKKQIPSIRLGKYWKFSPSALQRWLEGKNSA